ncbi:histidine phosphatase family protein [Oceanobacillus bengalensis]|uniref:Histidine phosphatase family protein n=1 Tax=Oceanobacillus bengalensis TaxID=1435466 RepID=A0A494YTH3_9BACI|nr:histidine phosphatase family protein [Oceanobacillus bengalensis]RKQ13431.1 histidine phosphatase family protein [Oceanobacillus bengalensis]
MLNLYFVRHGETEWNVQNRLQGQLDSRLTSNGIQSARLLARKLEATKFESVISSSSKRAVHTAELLIGNRPLSFRTDEHLLEINLGSWQGKTVEEIKKMDPHNYNCYFHHPNLYMRNENETENFIDVKERLEAFLKTMQKTYQSGNLLIVTHGMVIKVLQMMCKSNSIKQLWDPPAIEGTSLTVVRIEEGKRELLLEGSLSHKRGFPQV